MKRGFLFAIGMMFSIVAFAQSNGAWGTSTRFSKRTNPDIAEYYIKGYLSIKQGNYNLNNILTRGISFDGSNNPDTVWIGKETKLEDVLFQFEHYSTDYSGGVGSELDFWRFDESIMEWQPDGETRQANAKVPDNKSMVLMLVLDCSSSLRSDFEKVQGAAKDFIKDMLNASNANGQVKIGIVAFSKIGETEYFPITSLDFSSSDEMCKFIDRQHVDNGTALYYAMDKAVDYMEHYCAHSIPNDEPLSSAVMVTFTDGLDQTSRSESDGIKTADDYYVVVQRKMKNRRIDGISLQSKIRGVRGDDIITEKQLEKFKQIGNSLGEFKLLNDVSELGQEFKDIAEGLIGDFVVMECYVPNSFEGRVAWTYRTKPLRKKGKWFVGINVGAGPFANHHYYDGVKYFYDNHVAVSGGIDIAFPIGKSANLGIYSSIGYGSADLGSLLVGIGPLLLVNYSGGKALYLGVGWCGTYPDSFREQDGEGLGVRLGFKFKDGFYLFGEYNYTSYDYSRGWGRNYAALLHLGYSF